MEEKTYTVFDGDLFVANTNSFEEAVQICQHIDYYVDWATIEDIGYDNYEFENHLPNIYNNNTKMMTVVAEEFPELFMVI